LIRLSNIFEYQTFNRKIYKIMKNLLLLSFLGIVMISVSSCEKYDEDILPMVGVYEAHIAGVSGPFSMNITADYGDNIKIEAPWLEDQMKLVYADVNEEENFTKKIKIAEQTLSHGLRIYGDGVFQDYSVQIDYTIVDGYDLYHYVLIGTKL